MSIIEDSIKAVRDSDDYTGNDALLVRMIAGEILREYRKRLEAEPPPRVEVQKTTKNSISLNWAVLAGMNFDLLDIPVGEKREYMLLPVEESDE